MVGKKQDLLTKSEMPIVTPDLISRVSGMVAEKQDLILSKYPLLAQHLTFDSLDQISGVVEFNTIVASYFKDLATSLFITGDPMSDSIRMLTIHTDFPDLESFFVDITCDSLEKYNSIVAGFFSMCTGECSLL